MLPVTMDPMIDPALLQPAQDVCDDEDALEAQLQANIKQNQDAFVANGHGTIGHDHERALNRQTNDQPARRVEVSTAMSGGGNNKSGPDLHKRAGDRQADHTVPAEDGLQSRTSVESVDIMEGSEGTVETPAEEDGDTEIDICSVCGQADSQLVSEAHTTHCRVCRRPAHAECVNFSDKGEVGLWTCQKCSSRQSGSPKDNPRPRASSSRLVRDLLPVSRGVQKAGAYSIFNQPLLPETEQGSRALRKRVSPSVEPRVKPSKRRKMADEQLLNLNEIASTAPGLRRSSQKLETSTPSMPLARIIQHRPHHKPPPHKFVLAFRLDQTEIENILSKRSKPNRKYRRRKQQQKIPVVPAYQPPIPKFPALPSQHIIFPSMFGERENEINAKPYGGILSDAEADTSRSLPQLRERDLFESARRDAEEERRRTTMLAEEQLNAAAEGSVPPNSKRTVAGPPSKIKCIQFGRHVIDTSYAAPYPEEYSHESRLFICEFCLKYLPSEFVAWRHKLKCPAKHPPGDEIYRDGSLSIWEVDGRKKTEYCQCLCLMAKLFLGSKTLYYDVEPFLFYILTEYDEYGYHFVGYFSKEKRPASQNNVSCILVMPIHQRKGYATFLIEFSYLLTRIEGKDGSPEKPLSDMGLTAYRSYWDLTMSRHLLDLGDKPVSVRGMMERTGMTADDVVHSLERLYAFVADPVTKTYAIRYDKKLYESIVEKYDSKRFQKIRDECLVWTPYQMGRSGAAELDAQPVSTVAQREEDIIAAQAEESPEPLSPRSRRPSQDIDEDGPAVDPALIDDLGHIAPGPPVTGIVTSALQADENISNGQSLTNGVYTEQDSVTNPVREDGLSGYALFYKLEDIPPLRFLITPPVPKYLQHNRTPRRKSTANAVMPNSGRNTSSAAIRTSARKTGTPNRSIVGRSSRRSTPRKVNGLDSVRRSGRRSALGNESTIASQLGDDEDVEMMEPDQEGENDEQASTAEVASLPHDITDQDEHDIEEDNPDNEESGDEEEDEDQIVLEEDNASDDPDVDFEESDDSDESDREDEVEEEEEEEEEKYTIARRQRRRLKLQESDEEEEEEEEEELGEQQDEDEDEKGEDEQEQESSEVDETDESVLDHDPRSGLIEDSEEDAPGEEE